MASMSWTALSITARTALEILPGRCLCGVMLVSILLSESSLPTSEMCPLFSGEPGLDGGRLPASKSLESVMGLLDCEGGFLLGSAFADCETGETGGADPPAPALEDDVSDCGFVFSAD